MRPFLLLKSLFTGAIILQIGQSCIATAVSKDPAVLDLLQSIEASLEKDIVDVWYPRVVDLEYGGFLSNFDWQWNTLDHQEKAIVTQSRHIWTCVRLYQRYPGKTYLKTAAVRGGAFLREHFYDAESGGFYWMVDRKGAVLPGRDDPGLKQTYGIAFGIYAFAALYELTGDEGDLETAKDAFRWLETHAHDDEHLGYYELLTRSGEPVWDMENRRYPKGQNTTIHLLEAFAELYRVWPDVLLRIRLLELKDLLIERIIDPKGTLIQFFDEDWTPVSYVGMPEEAYRKVSYWDHVSFGHDVETAYLLWEADQVLGGKDEKRILQLGKHMVDHALEWGWDPENGGIVDGGYYVAKGDTCSIVRPEKTWWAQAEMLNAMLMFSTFYPDDAHHYAQRAAETWHYIQTYQIDSEHGGWYENGLDANPESEKWPKSHIWKGAYHNSRALLNARRWIGETSEL